MFRGGFLVLYPKSYPKKDDVIPQKNHLESNDSGRKLIRSARPTRPGFNNRQGRITRTLPVMGASTVEPMGKVICETTAEQYMVEVAGPKIEKMEESLRKTQKDVNAALERPLELGEEAVSSFIARIDAPIRQMVTQTKCAMPDTASLEARIADAVKDAARAGIAETTLNIEVHHSVQLEESTKERLD